MTAIPDDEDVSPAQFRGWLEPSLFALAVLLVFVGSAVGALRIEGLLDGRLNPLLWTLVRASPWFPLASVPVLLVALFRPRSPYRRHWLLALLPMVAHALLLVGSAAIVTYASFDSPVVGVFRDDALVEVVPSSEKLQIAAVFRANFLGCRQDVYEGGVFEPVLTHVATGCCDQKVTWIDGVPAFVGGTHLDPDRAACPGDAKFACLFGCGC